MFVGVDFFVRELPELRREGYSLEVLFFIFAEIIIAIWFMYKHSNAVTR